MKKDSKIFIAGHRGLVGSAIYQELQERGYTNLFVRTHSELDLSDQAKVDEFFSQEKFDYVFLCAAKVGGIYANNIYRADFIYQNLAIQNAVIHSAYKYGVKKLLFLGSSCIYPKNAPQPMRENALLSSELEYTNEPYAIAKIAGLKMCESYNLQYGTNFLSVMPTNLYGENDNFDLQNSHVLPALLKKIHLAKLLSEGRNDEVKREVGDLDLLQKHHISSEQVVLWGSGNPRREFLHSKDMARACVYIMQNIDFKDLCEGNEIRNTHINIGYGEDITIADLALMIKEIVGYRGEIVFDHSKLDGTMQKLLDTSKLTSLGWKPSIPLKEGIKEVYQLVYGKMG
ncbi:GDP-L-fucose synthase [Helicobacter cholecystus]|uniref:GDP-L-fucose synthase n=1 Tax=Helicobacter cholecystus TaxID=45498 RepID=A0A3D8ITM7_9HELI|nr:GDP-L-fucose synthase [Helicobacter cholecystus]RDU68657.1 GDP-L-fucose synthase [Helicobacter cholecystus]VEJ24450.1 GDP-fucose synthetase [Helicobacter cholecystus]